MDWNHMLSGKFWLTIISGVVFAYCAWKGTLSGEAVSAIVSMVFISYFQKGVNANNKPN